MCSCHRMRCGRNVFHTAIWAVMECVHLVSDGQLSPQYPLVHTRFNPKPGASGTTSFVARRFKIDKESIEGECE